MEEFLRGTNIGAGTGFRRALTSVSSGSSELLFADQVKGGVLTFPTRLGGGGSPTGNSCETDRDEISDAVTTGTVDSMGALVLSSCSSSASRLGEIMRERFSFISHNDRSEASIDRGISGG